MHQEASSTQIDPRPSRIVIATTNAGKTSEFRELLKPLGIPVFSIDNFEGLIVPEETADSFAENAELKAAAYALQIGEWVIADDSGLEVAALGGAPGVRSARFGGKESSYIEKMEHLLRDLWQNSPHRRDARFVSVIALAGPDGNVRFSTRGECRGAIANERRGSNGFGYDPIFIPEGYDRTFGEMSDEEKRSLSHRAKAAEELIRKMLDFIGL